MSDGDSPADGDAAYRARHDWDGAASMSETIVGAVEELREDSEVTGPRLYDAIDPDALNALLEPTATRDGHRTVSFVLSDYRITADSSGAVYVELVDGA